jgi:hypothetical protein
MEVLYWITRLDGIKMFLFIASAIFIIYSIASTIGHCVLIGYEYSGMRTEDDYTQAKVLWDKTWLKSIIITIFVVLFNIFTPTEKDAYIIYGVGGTIDYIKNNKIATKLPDKAIKALDLYLDKETKEIQESSVDVDSI